VRENRKSKRKRRNFIQIKHLIKKEHCFEKDPKVGKRRGSNYQMSGPDNNNTVKFEA
jgi:hypothetical protein